MESDSLLQSFLGALQASLAVLLTIFYGVVAAQFDLLDAQSAKKVSKICVRLFLPALLITNVGSELHADTATRYIPILCTSPGGHGLPCIKLHVGWIMVTVC